jgi:hypothetical protein
VPLREAAAGAAPAGIERISRWLAGRSSRRSFLGRAGQAAVLVAGGEVMAGLLLADPAEARVCGQSGVSNKCPTYDCDEVWGWCWYSTGCCADGLLKKICDCCGFGFPNVHGYCPSGHNVKCIVESCGADPRVQTRSTSRLPFDDPIALAAGVSSQRWIDGSAAAVVVAGVDALVAAIAAPLAAASNLPILLTGPAGLSGRTIAEIQRLGARRAIVVGVAAAAEGDLARYGLTVERVGPAGGGGDPGALSIEVARRLRAAGRPNRQVCVMATGESAVLAGVAGAAAAARGYPLVVGFTAALDGANDPAARAAVTFMCGPEAAAFAGDVPGGFPVTAAGRELTSDVIARSVLGQPPNAPGAALLPGAAIAGAAGLVGIGGPVLLHSAGSLDGVRDALFAIRTALRRVAVAGAAGGLGDEAVLELQSIINGFEAHKLIGVAGQGLPVISQPLDERPLGRARVGTAKAPPPDAAGGGYWTSRAGLDE